MVTVALLQFVVAGAEPIVLRGEQVPDLLGRPVAALRLCDRDGGPLPVQVDEVTDAGEYVCNRGESANDSAGNGVLDARDEIVFMYEDCAPCSSPGNAPGIAKSRIAVRVGTGSRCREAYLSADTSLPVAVKRYISYDHVTQYLATPWYFAQFAPDRFHFVRAGIVDPQTGGWITLTRELRIEILIKALWGLLPVNYTEDNLVCFVKRYKAGPVRLIRRGDLHLRIGAGIRGGRAAVNQICYPTMVNVPVSIHLPVRFRHFFREAYLEMTPVIDTAGAAYRFTVPGCGVSQPLRGGRGIDSLYQCVLNSHPFTLLNDGRGLGWVVKSDIPDSSGAGSGYIFRRPSRRGGVADCGYRLLISDVPRGYYTIVNRVLFTRTDREDIDREFKALSDKIQVVCGQTVSTNRLTDALMPGRAGSGACKKP
jgi:hypothetical protein